MKVKRSRKKMAIFTIIILVVLVGTIGCIAQRFGKAPQGEILERIESSPNYRDGKFQNYTPRIPRPKPTLKGWWNFAFGKKVEGFRPSMPLPSMKTNLKQIDRKENVLIWLGHSSLFIQIDGIRFLIDPVLITASPVPFVNTAFKGTKVYTPDDIPDIDYMLISHDHWDHLDYKTVKKLRNRIGKVICGLGVGEHFRQWKFNADDIIEFDWNENIVLQEKIILHILPARHYSGRASFGSDNTLWVSFMIEAPSSNIFVSGDTGYDIHFAEIKKQFQTIDLAIIEFGQYGYEWRDIHLIPDDFVLAITDLNPQRSFTVHNGKYALGRHPWKEPLEFISKLNEQKRFNIITPMIGELVYLNDFSQEFTKWWENIK